MEEEEKDYYPFFGICKECDEPGFLNNRKICQICTRKSLPWWKYSDRERKCKLCGEREIESGGFCEECMEKILKERMTKRRVR